MAKFEAEWGPWVVHDGAGCPVAAGTIVEVVCRDGFGFDMREVGCASGGAETSWDWRHYPRLKKIIRYRVKRPKGLTVLDSVLESLRETAPKAPARA